MTTEEFAIPASGLVSHRHGSAKEVLPFDTVGGLLSTVLMCVRAGSGSVVCLQCTLKFALFDEARLHLSGKPCSL